jgi:hypothetical protein
VHSLRRHYSGELAVGVPLHDEQSHLYLPDLVRAYGVQVHRYEVEERFREDNWYMKLTPKLPIVESLPWDEALIYENDFLFQSSPEPVFEICKGAQFGMASYHGCVGPTPGMKKQSTTGWKTFPALSLFMDPAAKNYNDGMIYVKKGCTLVPEWRELISAWWDWGAAEEHVHNYFMNQPEKVKAGLVAEVPMIYNMGVRFGASHEIKRSVAIHFLGGRHVKGSRHNGAVYDLRQTFVEAVLTHRFECTPGLMIWDPHWAALIDKAGGIQNFGRNPWAAPRHSSYPGERNSVS